ncbi:Detected protein of confused Function [Hibiscus syriacus]|uniref:Detected protein of confused Function n=1 Tax=Hibiscus syriacus TaxID=106335 RepID=A0A6A2YZG2_HIBSY|nr:Detected protein of confused Function [Hibiscus syriacus]
MFMLAGNVVYYWKEWRKRQIRRISDRVFERVKNQAARRNLTFEDLYIAVLLVYNDINKRLPGPHIDPPSKDQIRSIMKECDLNLDGEIDNNEFLKFIQRLTPDTISVVSRGLLVALVAAPTVAMAAKKATEGVPGVGRMVQKVPNSIYASLVTVATVWIQTSCEEIGD